MRRIALKSTRTFAILACVLTGAVEVAAQPSSISTPSSGTPRMFIDGAALSSYDDFVVSSTTRTSGVGVRVGIATRRYSASVEWETARDAGIEDFGTSPEVFFFSGGRGGYISLLQNVGHSTTYSVLVGVHTNSWKRLTFGLLGGPTFIASHALHSGNVADRTGPGAYLIKGSWAESSSKRAVAPTIGLELPIRITDQLFVVPELRSHYVNFLVASFGRSGVAIRWTF